MGVEKFKLGDKIKCVNDSPLSGNTVGPDLVIGEEYPVRNICIDKQGNQHIDVGLLSELNYVKSWDTGEELPQGDVIHWCHPSRFTLVTSKID